MIDQQIINKAVETLAAEAQPERIILFGSYARNEATEDSDVDLLVVIRNLKSSHQEKIRLHRCLVSLGIPIDLLVVSYKQFEKWSEAPSTTLYWAKREGKVMYESAA